MPRPSRLNIEVPSDFWLPEAACSYGYFLLAPNRWRPETQSFERKFDLAEFGMPPLGVEATIDQPGGQGAPMRVRCKASLGRAEQTRLKRAVSRMFHVDRDLAAWFRRSPAAAGRGFGRLFRSPTLFEDMVKTITNCNVGWPSTIKMNHLMVERVGEGAFPSPDRLARWAPARLQRVCRVGYRAKRIVGLARRFDRGEIDPEWYESPERSTDELREAILRFDGFGPYAAANVLQLLGRYDHLPIDTESYRLYCKQTGRPRPKNAKLLDPLIEARYKRFGKHRFIAYWFDLWRDYESQRGIAWTWQPREIGGRFTAASLE